MAPSMMNLSRSEAVQPRLRTAPPLDRTIGVHRTFARIPFPRHTGGIVLVLCFRDAWVSHSPPCVQKQRRP